MNFMKLYRSFICTNLIFINVHVYYVFIFISESDTKLFRIQFLVSNLIIRSTIPSINMISISSPSLNDNIIHVGSFLIISINVSISDYPQFV